MQSINSVNNPTNPTIINTENPNTHTVLLPPDNTALTIETLIIQNTQEYEVKKRHYEKFQIPACNLLATLSGSVVGIVVANQQEKLDEQKYQIFGQNSCYLLFCSLPLFYKFAAKYFDYCKAKTTNSTSPNLDNCENPITQLSDLKFTPSQLLPQIFTNSAAALTSAGINASIRFAENNKNDNLNFVFIALSAFTVNSIVSFLINLNHQKEIANLNRAIQEKSKNLIGAIAPENHKNSRPYISETGHPPIQEQNDDRSIHYRESPHLDTTNQHNLSLRPLPFESNSTSFSSASKPQPLAALEVSSRPDKPILNKYLDPDSQKIELIFGKDTTPPPSDGPQLNNETELKSFDNKTPRSHPSSARADTALSSQEMNNGGVLA